MDLLKQGNPVKKPDKFDGGKDEIAIQASRAAEVPFYSTCISTWHLYVLPVYLNTSHKGCPDSQPSRQIQPACRHTLTQR